MIEPAASSVTLCAPRVVVFCPNLIGDCVMATPVLRTLSQRLGPAQVACVVKPQVAPTLAGAPWFSQLILHDPRGRDSAVGTRAAIRQIRDGRFDAALLLPNSFRSALTVWRAGVSRRIGYARGGRRLLLTDRLLPPRDARGRFVPTPAVSYYAALLDPLGLRPDHLRLELFTRPQDEQQASDTLRRLRVDSNRPLVCLNSGGAFGPAKNWPVEHFSVLARRLASERDAAVLVVCGPAERESARAIVHQADHPHVVSLADEPLSIGLTKACVRRAHLLITTDSGPRHFAAAFDVPVVTLFGPTHIAWTRTYHPRATHLQRSVPCGPCQRPVCPEGHHRCMRELMPSEVYLAALRLLDGGVLKPSIRGSHPRASA